jgi:general secretion pathway protein K
MDRGAALLVAIVAIAVLTALAVDLAYETQVRLRIAANARDDLRAEALAHSAVNVSRLVLAFQNRIDQSMATMTPPPASATTGSTTPTPALPRPQIWNLIPVSSALTQALFPGDGPAAAAKPSHPAADTGAAEGGPVAPSMSYGDFEGGFQARIEDEGQKINAQLDARITSNLPQPQVESLLRMTCDTKWDPLFDRTDADGQRYSRSDLLVHLHDWVVLDTSGSSLAVSFSAGNCSFSVPKKPFEAGFSDKNFPYDRGRDRYRTKNARMDSLDELYLIAGVTDAFMAAFADRLTVYLPVEAQINVNTTDADEQLRIATVLADFTKPTTQARLLDPKFKETLHEAISKSTMNGFATLTPAQFAQVLQSPPVNLPVRTDVPLQGANTPFTDRSLVFRIRALGVAGDVTHETEAVVSYDPKLAQQQQNAQLNAQPSTQQNTQQTTQSPLGALAAAAQLVSGQLNLGQLIHWRED